MKRQVFLYITNVLLFVLSIVVVATGIIKFPGLLELVNIDPFSLPLGLFTFLHDWGGIILTALTLLHIFLNWPWIKRMTNKLVDPKIIRIALIALLIISGIYFVIQSIYVDQSETQEYADQGDQQTGEKELLENTVPLEENQIVIEDIGVFNFEPSKVKTVRKDVFNDGYFSVFDILIYFNDLAQIDMDFEYSEIHHTHIIKSINGIENWWYVAFYDGGWAENNVWRMDLFPYKDRTSIFIRQVSPEAISTIYTVFAEEVERAGSQIDQITIPKVIINGRIKGQQFENIAIIPHDLRTDYFVEGTITAIDVVLSLSDLGLITHTLNWYESIGSAGIVKNYFVDEINGDVSHDRCGFVYELGDAVFTGFRGNHIHIPSDIRVITTVPEYVEFFWICI